MTEPEIRPARAGDRDAVAALLERAGLPPEGLDDQFGEAYAVAAADGRLVGAAGMEAYGGAGLLRSVAVDPEWRGRGLGQRLTEDRLGWAGARGLGAVYLLTTTAAGFFPRLGFSPVARDEVPAEVRASPQFAGVCPSTAAVLALGLGAPFAAR